jgi:hypothetical protein
VVKQWNSGGGVAHRVVDHVASSLPAHTVARSVHASVDHDEALVGAQDCTAIYPLHQVFRQMFHHDKEVTSGGPTTIGFGFRAVVTSSRLASPLDFLIVADAWPTPPVDPH